MTAQADRPRVVVQYDKVMVVHATAGPQGNQGVQGPVGPQGPPGESATLPSEWINPPDLTVLFENRLV